MPAIVVLGDRTDHGGEVIEASGVTDTHNRRIARIGDKVQCPKKGHGATIIIEGDLTFVIDGKGAAYHGCKTSCGAILISSQSVTTINFGGGGGGQAAATSSSQALATSFRAANSPEAARTESAASPPQENAIFDEQFELLDSEGNALVEVPYTVKFASGMVEHGETDASGRTKRFITDDAESLELFLGHV
jgi:uncharacterized Zn-binding protein involved in type VI secretion